MTEKKTHKCKITVLRREYFQDLADEFLPDPSLGECQLFSDGQEIIVDGENYSPMVHSQFCHGAWDSISKYVYAAIQGGAIMQGWTHDENVMISCCNSGIRPVIFKLERIDT